MLWRKQSRVRSVENVGYRDLSFPISKAFMLKKTFWWGVKTLLPCLCHPGDPVTREIATISLLHHSSLTHALTKRSLLCLVVATCWSMTSFKITLVVLLIHLRWHMRFADAAHSLKFREVLTCCKKKTNCISFLAEAGKCLLMFSCLVYLGLHILR